MKGGWIQYEYVSSDSSAKTNTYKVTVRQYLECGSDQKRDATVNLGVYITGIASVYNTYTFTLTNTIIPNKTTFDPCIDKKPVVCYRIDIYEREITLPFNIFGYTLAVQRCCRIAGILNVSNSNNIGVTYSNTIPGTISGTNYGNNNSPLFGTKDTVVICNESPFSFDFSATDIDGDSLSYVFCNGNTGGSQGMSKPDVPSAPPYSSIPYQQPYTSWQPLGNKVSINSITGIISGVAPNQTGDFVIAVCVQEFRNKVLIGSTKKEIHVTVANCKLNSAKLEPTYTNCDNLIFQFQNESSATNIISYLWEFGNGDTSHQPTPKYEYKDTGVYKLKLTVVSTGCTDTGSAIVRAFPGFKVDFSHIGYCFQSPFIFKNQTFAQYGFVDSVHYDFGVPNLITDTSILKNPTFKYQVAGKYQVRLFAHSTKGCSKDTVKLVEAFDKPFIKLKFKDTLICSIDSLPLLATSTPNAIYSWSPNVEIDNVNIPNPLVHPKDTILYILTVRDSGCVNKDTVKVNVLDFINVDAGQDVSICLTDGYKMKTISHALGYKWVPAIKFDNPNIKFPIAKPTDSITIFYVYANLGYCQAKDSITIKTYPYAFAQAKPDTSICFGDSVQLEGIIKTSTLPSADSFYWTPKNLMINPNSLTPIVRPNFTQRYVLTSFYTKGCSKPVRDTVTVKVIQPFFVFAGKDTDVVVNQPVEFFAKVLDTTGIKFLWTNVQSSISFSNLQKPTFVFNANQKNEVFAVKAYTKEGCEANDTIKIRVFQTKPSIFTPNAFTPNNDGNNDYFKPVCAGIFKLEYFTIFNRFGKQVYTTSQIGSGWDGRVAGEKQQPGTFVYILKGLDYLGNIIEQKGTFVLIR